MPIRLRRIYDAPSAEDGVRVLVDRLWPRGLTKGAAAVDLWLKDAAPSTELRRWFAHNASKWRGFVERYHHELRAHAAAVEQIRELARRGSVTLVYAARDEEHNNAVALRDYLGSPEPSRGS